jgi:hypothetical protein
MGIILAQDSTAKPSKLMYLHKVLDCVGVIATLANVVVE